VSNFVTWSGTSVILQPVRACNLIPNQVRLRPEATAYITVVPHVYDENISAIKCVLKTALVINLLRGSLEEQEKTRTTKFMSAGRS